jgi:hypothetical protein
LTKQHNAYREKELCRRFAYCAGNAQQASKRSRGNRKDVWQTLLVDVIQISRIILLIYNKGAPLPCSQCMIQHLSIENRDRHRAGLPCCPTALPCPPGQGEIFFLSPALAALQDRAGKIFCSGKFFLETLIWDRFSRGCLSLMSKMIKITFVKILS